ncbi:MAG: carboxypeptidase-like regulatory domain-containing protein [Gemmatimonadota bacterium]
MWPSPVRSLLLAALVVGPTAAGAQVPADLPVLEGRVVRVDGAPVAGADVLLHRVAVDSAGEVARLTSDADGAFRFRFPYVPDPQRLREVFFGSVRHQGILYFGGTLTTAADLDSLYVIEVYDTAAAPSGGAPLAIEARNVVLEPSDSGWRVTDLVEIRNDSSRTWVSATPGEPVWSLPFPPGSTDHQVGDSDLPPDAARFVEGRAELTAAVPPGTRVYLFRYVVPDMAFTLPVAAPTAHLDLLIREPAPDLTVLGLEGAPPAELEPGTTFRRFVGEDVAVPAVRVLPGGGEEPLPLAGMMVGLGLGLGLVGLWAALRARGGQGPVPAGAGPTREELILEIARLDAAFAREASPDPAAVRAYHDRRAVLRRALGEPPGRDT